MLLALCRLRLETYHRVRVGELAKVGFVRRWLWPSLHCLALEHVVADLKDGLTILRKMEDSNEHTTQSALFLFLARCGVAENIVKDMVTVAELQRRSLEQAFRHRSRNSAGRLKTSGIQESRKSYCRNRLRASKGNSASC
jgi:hypothetical protein